MSYYGSNQKIEIKFTVSKGAARNIGIFTLTMLIITIGLAIVFGISKNNNVGLAAIIVPTVTVLIDLIGAAISNIRLLGGISKDVAKKMAKNVLIFGLLAALMVWLIFWLANTYSIFVSMGVIFPLIFLCGGIAIWIVVKKEREKSGYRTPPPMDPKQKKILKRVLLFFVSMVLVIVIIAVVIMQDFNSRWE